MTTQPERTIELEAKVARLEAALKATVAGLRKIAEHQDNWQADVSLDALYNMACALDTPQPPPAARSQSAQEA